MLAARGLVTRPFSVRGLAVATAESTSTELPEYCVEQSWLTARDAVFSRSSPRIRSAVMGGSVSDCAGEVNLGAAALGDGVSWCLGKECDDVSASDCMTALPCLCRVEGPPSLCVMFAQRPKEFLKL